MRSFTRLDIIFGLILILLGIGIIILIIILFTNRPKELKGNEGDDIIISYFSSLDFVEIDSSPVYGESSKNLGLAGRLILDCFTGTCQVEDSYYDEDDGPTYYYKDVIDYSCSQQCSYNGSNECICSTYQAIGKGKCSRLYDDSYRIGKYCYTDNVIYNWKGKKYNPNEKPILTYYQDAKLKEEECPKGTINCGIIDDNENKLCISSYSNCPINYLSENKLNSNKIHSTVDIGNKTFYYTFDEDSKMKRKIIGGLVADTDLYLNKDNDEKVLIDTGTISEFLADNKYLYKGVNLGYDPYKKENIDNKGNSYLRIFYNNKVDLKKHRSNKKNHQKEYSINKEIDEVRKSSKSIMIFGLISYISYLISIIFFVIFKDFDVKIVPIFITLFGVFYIISFTYVCINISEFNKLEDLYENDDNFPRIINLIIFILYLILLIYIIFLSIYLKHLRKNCREGFCNICNKKNEANNTTMAGEKITEKNKNQNDKSAQGGQISSLNISGNN